MLNLILFDVLTSTLIVIFVNPSYIWMPSAFIFMCYILDEIDRKNNRQFKE